MSALDFDPDRHRDPHEPEHHWALRRRFLAHNMGRYPEEKLVSLAQVFANMEFLGCRSVTGRDVQIIAFSIFGPCCDDVIAWALEQFLGPCNNGNEAVEEMPRSVKISILS